MSKVVFLALALCSSVAHGAGPAPGLQQQFPPVDSPNGTFVAEFYVGLAAEGVWEGNRQLWIRSKAHPDDAAMIYEYDRNVSVLFSPDENWLIVNDEAASNITFPLLFKHQRNASFSRVDGDIAQKSWRLLLRQNHLKPPLDLDHTYAFALSWAPDSAAFLLSLTGHTDIDHHVDGWLCVFDMKTLRVTPDLSLMNRGAVQIGPQQSTLRQSTRSAR